MISKALRRAATSWKTFIFAAVLFSLGGVASVWATQFTADNAVSTATIPAGWVAWPSAATVVGSTIGLSRTVTWAVPTTTGINGYLVRETDRGTTTTACPATNVSTVGATTATYLGTTVAYPATTVTTPVLYPATVANVSGAGTHTTAATIPSSDNGDYVCFQVQSYYQTNGWVGATVPVAGGSPTRIGLWPTTVAHANGGTKNQIDNSDTIKITYNQNVQPPTGSTITICTFTNGTLLIGDSGCGSSSDVPTVGKLTGLSITTARTFASSSWTTSGTAITFKLAGGTSSGASSGVGTWTSSGSFVSATAGGNPSPCTQSACTPTVSGGW